MIMKWTLLALAGSLVFTGPTGPARLRAPARVVPNDNRMPGGSMRGDTLVLQLVVGEAEWYPESEDGPHITVEAFGEAGQAPRIPAPLIRVRTGTPIRARIRNTLPDSTIHVIGLAAQPVPMADTLHLAPGDSTERIFVAGPPGSYLYRAVIGNNPDGRPSERETAVGAFIIDPEEGAPPDRIFVLNVVSQEARATAPLRQALTINGRSWPHTERLPMTVGDTARWRVLNGTTRAHPMHLHGFYFRTEAQGDGRASRLIPAERRRLAVTELLQPWGTRTLVWSPDRPGNWLFHCHLMFHVTPEARLDHGDMHRTDIHSADPGKHMAGLVLGIPVAPKPGESYERTGEPRRLNLFFHQGGARGSAPARYSYVLLRGPSAPAPDSLEIPGSPIVVTRGTATDIVVHNRAREATGVHWHGLELESWSDGVVGWSSRGDAMAPAIAPGDSFVARLSLPRAGTFIYHTHLNDIDQVTGGAAGPLVVLEPGEQFDPARDHIYLSLWNGRVASPLTPPNILINGDSVGAPDKVLAPGMVHRFRLINIGAAGSVRFALRRDTTAVPWHPRAKDGADLPAALRAEQPAVQLVTVGETFDFELTPPGPGVYELSAVHVPPPGLPLPSRRWRQRLIVP
jgi:FtsP/CotA-like multicopper oxidase with cupredoxin domain